MRANHFDTHLPSPPRAAADAIVDGTDEMAKDFKRLKYELVKILAT